MGLFCRPFTRVEFDERGETMKINEYEAIQTSLSLLMTDEAMKRKWIGSRAEREAYKKAVLACKSVVNSFFNTQTMEETLGEH